VFLALSPFMRDIFDLLSAPLMSVLPEGTKLIATGVITPFMVPLKVTLFVVLPHRAAVRAVPGLGLRRAGAVPAREAAGAPIIASSVAMFALGMAYCYFVVFRLVFRFIASFAPSSVNVAPDIDAYFSFVLGLFLAFGLTFEVPIVVVLLARFGIADVERLKAGAALRDRRRLHPRRHLHAAGRDLAAPAGDTAVPAVRDRHPAGTGGRQACRSRGSRRRARRRLKAAVDA
jgi:sec-independent protein translocase protein TatC